MPAGYARLSTALGIKNVENLGESGRGRLASGGAVDSRSAFAIANESESVAESADIYPLVTIVLVVGYGIPKRKQDCGFSPSDRIRHITILWLLSCL